MQLEEVLAILTYFHSLELLVIFPNEIRKLHSLDVVPASTIGFRAISLQQLTRF